MFNITIMLSDHVVPCTCCLMVSAYILVILITSCEGYVYIGYSYY